MPRELAFCLLLLLAGLLTVPSRSLRAARDVESPCVPEYSKAAAPQLVLLGEDVSITLRVRAACPGDVAPWHLVFALDGSASMAGARTRRMKAAAADVTRSLDLDHNRSTQVGVVEFDGGARALCPLSGETQRIVTCIDKVGAAGGSAIHKGIDEALRTLAKGRSVFGAKEMAQTIVLLSNGHDDAGCSPLVAAANRAKGQGVTVISVCVGPNCNASCMRRAATDPRFYADSEDRSRLLEMFERIRDSGGLSVVVHTLEVEDTIPPSMAHVPGSASPPPTEPQTPTDWLRWEETFVPREGLTYTYRVRPLVAGYLATNATATGRLTDNRQRIKDWTFDTPWVTVLRPDVLPPPANHTLVWTLPRSFGSCCVPPGEASWHEAAIRATSSPGSPLGD
jgi:uncharacterized protein YegL